MPLAPLSASNEEHAFRLIAASLEAKLAGYASAVEEDEFELSSHAARGAGGGGEAREHVDVVEAAAAAVASMAAASGG